MIEVRIPLPPSKNRLYGRSKSGHIYRRPDYEKWRCEAGWAVIQQGRPTRLEGAYKLTITAPSMRLDLGNVETAISDFLQWFELVENDRKAVEITIRKGSSQDVLVKIEATS